MHIAILNIIQVHFRIGLKQQIHKKNWLKYSNKNIT